MPRRPGPVIGPLRATSLWRLISVSIEQRKGARAWRGTAADIASYHEARRGREPGETISDRVWSDLELESVYKRVDNCNSSLGQQVLYDMMRRPLYDGSAVLRRSQAASALRARPELRNNIRSAVRSLASSAAYELHHLSAHDLPTRPAWFALLPLLSLAALSAIVLLFISPKLGLLLLLGIVGANIGIQIYYRPRVQHLVRAIAALPSLVSAARQLSTLNAPELAEVVVSLPDRVNALRWVRWLSLHVRREDDSDPITGMVTGYLNLLFLADVNAFAFSIDMITRHRGDIEEILHTVGLLDALSAVVAFQDSLPFWCVPEFASAPKSVVGQAIYHPSLAQPVPNDLRLNESSWLITGSNMAGKTTFLRAAGVCVVLAQTLATCPARRWRAPILRVRTFINRHDDLLSGKSYFLVEAEYLREMLTRSTDTAASIFIIDELYRGTNTRERVAAARAVLEQLNGRDHLCLISTHDLELIELLRGRWEYWHFQESVDDSQIHFDYRLQPGAVTAGNALKLLAASDYPADVMVNAYSTFQHLGRGSGGDTVPPAEAHSQIADAHPAAKSQL